MKRSENLTPLPGRGAGFQKEPFFIYFSATICCLSDSDAKPASPRQQSPGLEERSGSPRRTVFVFSGPDRRCLVHRPEVRQCFFELFHEKEAVQFVINNSRNVNYYQRNVNALRHLDVLQQPQHSFHQLRKFEACKPDVFKSLLQEVMNHLSILRQTTSELTTEHGNRQFGERRPDRLYDLLDLRNLTDAQK